MNERLPDMLAVVLTLVPVRPPEGDRSLPRWWGRAAHAAFLQAIASQLPSLADQLHDSSLPRPFTVSNLMGKFNQGVPLSTEAYRLRLTSLTNDLSSAFTAALSDGGALSPGAVLDLDYLPFTITHVTSADTPWTGADRYADVLQRCTLSAVQPDRRLRFQFASPTCFHQAEKTMPLPLPDLVFGSLLQRWNAFAPLTLPDETRRYAAECLAISNFHLSSRLAGLKETGLRVGCSGSVTYTSLNPDRYWLGLMHALAEFALFSGVGISTAQGLGQCRSLADPAL